MIPRRDTFLMLVALVLGLPHTGRTLAQTEPPPTRMVHAVFSSTTPGGIVTDVIVDVTGGPDGPEAVIEVSRYRPTCAHHGCPQELLHAFNRVPLPAGALQMTGELETVTVRGTAPVHEPLVPGVGTATLDLTWTAAGPVSTHEHEEEERFRRATASGTLSAGTANFTPQDSVAASIEEL
jgi:hypothetical protein